MCPQGAQGPPGGIGSAGAVGEKVRINVSILNLCSVFKRLAPQLIGILMLLSLDNDQTLLLQNREKMVKLETQVQAESLVFQ